MFWFILTLIIIALLPFGFKFAIYYGEGDKSLQLNVWFLQPRLAINLGSFDAGKSLDYLVIVKEVLKGERDFKLGKLLIFLLGQSTWQSLALDGLVGLQDSAETAILLGSIWALLPPLMTLIQARFPALPQITTNLRPQFNKEEIKISLKGILKITMGKLVINSLLFFLKKKGGASFGRATY